MPLTEDRARPVGNNCNFTWLPRCGTSKSQGAEDPLSLADDDESSEAEYCQQHRDKKRSSNSVPSHTYNLPLCARANVL